MKRLPRGWTRIKDVGSVDIVRILVHTDRGVFGTLLENSDRVEEHASLADAVLHVKKLQEDGSVEAVHAESDWKGERPITLKSIRVKKRGKYWVRPDGSYVANTLYIPDPAVAAELAEIHKKYTILTEQLAALRNEATTLIATKLNQLV